MQEKHRETLSKSRQKVVTALGKLLMDSSLEELLIFLQRLGVRFSVSGNMPHHERPGTGYHRCKIFIQENRDGEIVTTEKYEGVNPQSVKGAIVAAIAKFLVNEEHDYHDYGGLIPAKEMDETIV